MIDRLVYDAVRHFYPRPPGGGRQREILVLRKLLELFLSTPSGWRATGAMTTVADYAQFLSTPSGWRATAPRRMLIPLTADFYPRPPGGGRPSPKSSVKFWRYFYPRPPGGGRRTLKTWSSAKSGISIHALRVEGDQSTTRNCSRRSTFLSTPSGWRATPKRAL